MGATTDQRRRAYLGTEQVSAKSAISRSVQLTIVIEGGARRSARSASGLWARAAASLSGCTTTVQELCDARQSARSVCRRALWLVFGGMPAVMDITWLGDAAVVSGADRYSERVQ